MSIRLTLLGLLSALAAMTAMAAPGFRLEGEPFLPYRINHAVASDQDGLLGSLELKGLRWDGSRVVLFRTFVKARSQAVDLVFYLDEDIRGLELQVLDRSVSLDLAAGEGKGGRVTVDETAVRNRMRGLDPPIHLAPDGEAPEHFSLMGADLVMAGFQASTSLFGLPISRAPLWLLGGFALIVVARPFGKRGWAVLVRVIAAGAGTLVIVFLAARTPTLFSVALPGDDPGARVSGMLGRRVDELPGYTRVAYGAAQEEGTSVPKPGRVELVGLWTPAGRGIPLAEVVPPGSLVRFSFPPSVTVVDGEACVGSKDFVSGWVVHANH